MLQLQLKPKMKLIGQTFDGGSRPENIKFNFFVIFCHFVVLKLELFLLVQFWAEIWNFRSEIFFLGPYGAHNDVTTPCITTLVKPTCNNPEAKVDKRLEPAKIAKTILLQILRIFLFQNF